MVSAGVRLALVAIGGLSIAGPAWVVTHPPALHLVKRPRALPPRRVVPRAQVPQVEPVAFVDLTTADARAYNASIPFSTAPNPAARPYRFVGDAEQRARAIDCLAAGQLYEAGDDTVGERAVAQVVLNRLRHPAFPKTVCGVVFEGAERTTGCQFTFACDGALTRWRPTEAAWARARTVATAALSGAVFRPVGYATHYHTDWVVPYWQSSLDKIAGVGAHLFFRWSGWWGTPPAFNRHPSPDEPVVAALAPLSDAHRTAAAMTEAKGAVATAALTAALVAGAMAPGTPEAPAGVTATDDTSFVAVLPKGLAPDAYPALADAACGTRDRCKFLAWTDPAKVARNGVPTDDQYATMTFSHLRDRRMNFARTLWNCRQHPRADPRQCMKDSTPPTPVQAAPDPLPGVRHKPGATPAPGRDADVTPPGTSPAGAP